MKFTPIILWLLISLTVNSQEPANPTLYGPVFNDPRQIASFYAWIEDGEHPKNVRLISQSILIICWMPAPDGTFGQYQISGLEGYYTQEQVERFLAAFYALDHYKEAGVYQPNLIVAGNNWGAGGALKTKLEELSKAKSFSVFFAGGWAFSKVALIVEPKERHQLIQVAYKNANPP